MTNHVTAEPTAPEVGRGTRGEGDREVSLTTVIPQRLTLFKAIEMEVSIDAVDYM